MPTVVEQASFSLIELGIAGVFILFLIALFYYTSKLSAQERAVAEARDTERESSLRTAVERALAERHDDSVLIVSRLSKIEAMLEIRGDK